MKVACLSKTSLMTSREQDEKQLFHLLYISPLSFGLNQHHAYLRNDLINRLICFEHGSFSLLVTSLGRREKRV